MQSALPRFARAKEHGVRERGRALLQERAHALGIIGREARLALHLALEIELGVEIVAPGVIERALDQRERDRRAPR